MMITKPFKFGVPIFVVAAMFAVMALWAWSPIGGAGGGPTETAALRGQITWTVYDAYGNIKAHDVIQNAINGTEGIDAAMERLILALNADQGEAFAQPGAAEIGEANAFDNIVAIADENDAASDDWDSGNVTANLDGDFVDLFNFDNTGDGNQDNGNNNDGVNDQDGNSVAAPDGIEDNPNGEQNPADGTYAGGAAGDGVGEVTVSYRANGIAVIRQLGLVKTAPDDNTASGGVTIPDQDILASQAVNITLADGDTLEVTWELTVSTAGGF